MNFWINCMYSLVDLLACTSSIVLHNIIGLKTLAYVSAKKKKCRNFVGLLTLVSFIFTSPTWYTNTVVIRINWLLLETNQPISCSTWQLCYYSPCQYSNSYRIQFAVLKTRMSDNFTNIWGKTTKANKKSFGNFSISASTTLNHVYL